LRLRLAGLLAAGGWRLAAGGWRLAAGGWRLREHSRVILRSPSSLALLEGGLRDEGSAVLD
jgi:hypothetical protein